MATITFDTLRTIDTLKNAGADDAQARAQAEALSIAINEAMDTQLTKRRVNLEKIERELLFIKWMLGLVAGGEVSFVLKKF